MNGFFMGIPVKTTTDDESVAKYVEYLEKYNNEFGSVSDGINVRYFKATGGYRWTSEPKPHYFNSVPATEYVENEEQIGIFEPEMTIIDAYNKAISEKRTMWTTSQMLTSRYWGQL